MDEGRKLVIGIMASILASLHMQTAADLFGKPYPMKSNPTDEETRQYKIAVDKFVTNELSDLDGFVLFDTANRYEIDFPTGWEKRAKESAAQK